MTGKRSINLTHVQLKTSRLGAIRTFCRKSCIASSPHDIGRLRIWDWLLEHRLLRALRDTSADR